jgi:ABC-type transport system involved in multi-copper enzyme maturation permease subunit
MAEKSEQTREAVQVQAARLSGMAAAMILARLTFRRLFRSRTMVVSGIFCLLPIIFAWSVRRASSQDVFHQWRTVYGVWLLILAIVPPLHLAATVAEEVENKTFTYLWSRPFPRWSLIVGKLLTLVPVLALMICATLMVSYGTIDSAGELGLRGRAAAGMAMGVLAIGCMSIGIGSLIHKHALVVAISYVFVLDLPIGVLPFALQNLAITYQVKQIGIDGSGGYVTPMLWLVGISALWLALGLWRVRRAEYATDK